MEIISALLALCEGNSPVTGEFPLHRPVTRSLRVFFDVRLNKRVRKQSKRWWFETRLCTLWRHCNGVPPQPPGPSVPWTGILNATHAGWVCPQMGIFHEDTQELFQNEDCLNLNIYTPYQVSPHCKSPSARFIMTSSNGNIFCVTGPLCGEFTGPRWIPRTKASDAELWCFLWCAPE